MRRWYLAAPLLAAAFAVGCKDNPASIMTGPQVRAKALSGPVTGAAFTTINATVDATGSVTVDSLCKNGNPSINCNIYGSKSYVWLNGGPAAAYVGDGVYFFDVLQPGGQADPNDGTSHNLSDLSPTTNTGAGDAYTNRIFSVANGVVSYSGTHDFNSNKIRLMPYDDTPNPGGVYIMAICYLGPDMQHLSYPVAASSCKYDAFKVRGPNVPPTAEAPEITKDVSASYDHSFTWGIDKSVDKTKVTGLVPGATATFTYTVDVTHTDNGTSNFSLTGTITVTNSNVDNITGATVTDTLTGGTVCTVTGGTNATLVPGQNTFAYTCPVSALPTSAISNYATVTWPAQTLTAGNLAAGSADFSIAVTFVEHLIDDKVVVTDSAFADAHDTLGTVLYTDPNPTSFTYSRNFLVPDYGCVTYNNKATFVTDSTKTTGSDTASVQVCRVPPETGALTMGFWQNKNGQGIITSYCGGSTGLKAFLNTYNPYKDLTSTTCAGAATYVYNIIKAATAGGTTMNPMLRAQMLATALDVYFSDPALGGNRINAPSPIGGISIDLVHLNASNENVSSAFGGATHLTVLQMIAYAASQATPNTGLVTWYAQNKTTQGLAKDAFDSINNELAFQGP